MLYNNDILYEYPLPDKLIVIGDIHGDIKRLKNILIDAGIINTNLEWISYNTIVVQMGDQIDSINRDNNYPEWEKLKDIEVLYFTNTLNNIAYTKNSRFISLIGNHEMMNVFGNFSYVSSNSNFNERLEYFKPKGKLSNILSNRPIILKIGELLFCHSFFKKEHYDLLKKYNKHPSYLNTIWKNLMLYNNVFPDDNELFTKIILDSENGILWNRTLFNTDDESKFYELISVIMDLDCNYMFIGHTPIEKITLLSSHIWCMDTGISRAFNRKSYQYIEIQNNTINIKNIDE